MSKKDKLLKQYKVVDWMQPYEYVIEATSKESAENRVVISQAFDTSDVYKIKNARYFG